MEGFFSKSAFKRLPVAIQRLPENQRAAFIMLRMRKSDSHIAHELGVPLEEAREIIGSVPQTLVKSGALDLIQDPVFFRIDHPAPGQDESSRLFELSSEDMDVADQISLDRFYNILATSLDELPKESRRLMGLWFNKEMKAKDILNFYKKLGIPLSDRKPI